MTDNQISNVGAEGARATTCAPFCYEPQPAAGSTLGKLGCFVLGAVVGAGAVALAAVLADEWPGTAHDTETATEDAADDNTIASADYSELD